MSTRAQIIIQDEQDLLWFYRHSDGYPEVCGESLKTFLRWLLDGKIRNNVGQSAGWLIVMGAAEYSHHIGIGIVSIEPAPTKIFIEPKATIMGWKCGAYEPAICCQMDVEYVYVIDLVAKEIRCYEPDGVSECEAKFDPKNPPKPFYIVSAKNIDKPIKVV